MVDSVLYYRFSGIQSLGRFIFGSEPGKPALYFGSLSAESLDAPVGFQNLLHQELF